MRILRNVIAEIPHVHSMGHVYLLKVLCTKLQWRKSITTTTTTPTTTTVAATTTREKPTQSLRKIHLKKDMMVIVQLSTTETSQIRQHWLHTFGNSRTGVPTTTCLGVLLKRVSHSTPAHAGAVYA